jgi:hypothetical protein
MGWQGKDPSTDFRYYIFSSVPAAISYPVFSVVTLVNLESRDR